MANEVFIVFDGPPGPESGRFVEVEDARGHSVGTVADWNQRKDGLWILGPFNGGRRLKKTPESRFYDVLKGHEVLVVFKSDETPLTATLLWVDRYTLGLRIGDTEQMINKSSIHSLERAQDLSEDQRDRGDTAQ